MKMLKNIGVLIILTSILIGMIYGWKTGLILGIFYFLIMQL